MICNACNIKEVLEGASKCESCLGLLNHKFKPLNQWYPTYKNDMWVAEKKIVNFASKEVKIINTDMNGDILDLVDFEFAAGWCDSRNAIDKL